jgi:hypothetical protein
MEPSREAVLRAQLFDRFATNLAALGRQFADFPKRQNTFLCPVCLTEFGREALEGGTPAVSLEHAIPECLGGTNATATLTCTRCNNIGGSAVDVHAQRRLAADEFLAGIYEQEAYRGSVEIAGSKVQAEIAIRAGQEKSMKVRPVPKCSRPGQIEAIERELMARVSDPNPIEIRFSVDLGYKAPNSNAALLRIGFLMAFRQFGYGYILHENVEQVRRQILNPGELIIPEPVSFAFREPPPQVNAMGAVTAPESLLSFIAMVRLKTDNRVLNVGILMPGLNEDGGQIFDRFRPAHRSSYARANILPFSYNPDFLTHEHAGQYVPAVWQGVLRANTAIRVGGTPL